MHRGYAFNNTNLENFGARCDELSRGYWYNMRKYGKLFESKEAGL
jgi:hypothetical protein